MCNLSEALVENTMEKTVRNMLAKGRTADEIAYLTGYPISFVESVQAEDLDDEE